MTRGWALSQAIVAWVISNYETEDSQLSTESLAIYWKYLVYQARVVCHAKKFRDANGANGYAGIPLARQVQQLIERLFRGIKSFCAEWDSFGDFEPETF